MSSLKTTWLWTALVTPLNPDGSLNESDLINLVHEQEHAGNGIVILGSTGEALNLKITEKESIIAIISELNLKIPIIAGVGGFDLESTLEWLDYLETKNIDGYLMVTPMYSKPGVEGQFHWFKTLMDHVSRPCMLYNVPGRTAIALNTDSARRLASHPNFWAIKESSGSPDLMIKYQDAVGMGNIYCGDDPCLADFVSCGAVGLVSVASNVWPREVHAYVELGLQHKLTMADIHLWKMASLALFKSSNPVPVKALMAKEGRIKSSCVKLPLHSDDYKQLDELIEYSNQVRLWFENCKYSGRIKTENEKIGTIS
ncbi:MAG TPA: 4-hydroxy-tetrahydrodipicolinate synthase [Bacteroidetes bacterium]|nr:4-hydroxy-tetrahydrodipicolinate synthase [Bacteroidota bacterium]